MISIIICSRNGHFKQQIEKNIAETIGAEYELIIIDNIVDPKGICAVYNTGAAKAKYDILCFVHEDVLFTTLNWGKILINYINNNIDVIGVGGSKYKSKTLSGCASAAVELDCFNVNHLSPSGEIIKLFTRPPHSESDVEDVCCLDGVFITAKKSIWQKIKFDEERLKGFHIYDLDFSLRASQIAKVVVTYSIDITHVTKGGDYGKKWMIDVIAFHKHYQSLLPKSIEKLTQKQYKKYEKRTQKFWLKRIKNEQIPLKYKLIWLKQTKALFKPFTWKHAIRFLLYNNKKKSYP